MNDLLCPLHPSDLDIRRRHTPDGASLMRSAVPSGSCSGRRLLQWATLTPERIFLGRRGPAGEWLTLTYGETLADTQRLAQALLDRRLSESRTLLILSENSLEHALLALAAMHVGVPYSPVSPTYSLMSRDFARLRQIGDLMRPGLIFASDGRKYERAIAALAGPNTEVVVTGNLPEHLPSTRFADLLATPATVRVKTAFERSGPETVAKVLFTCDSSGQMKGVILTQGMLCASQQLVRQTYPFLAETPQVTLCWLPWSHAFGGNQSFDMMLDNGGSFYIDDGKPARSGIKATVDNLRDVAPTIYTNVARGFAALLPYFETDKGLRNHFYSRLQMLHGGRAALPRQLRSRLEALAVQSYGKPVAITAGLACTEADSAVLSATRLSVTWLSRAKEG